MKVFEGVHKNVQLKILFANGQKFVTKL